LHAPAPPPESDSPSSTLGLRLDEVEVALFVRHGRARRVPPGTVLFERDRPCHTLYVIIHGEIEIEVELDDDGAAERLGVGHAVCELGLLRSDIPCPASGVAIVDSTLVELDVRDFDRLVDDDAATLSRFLHRAFARTVQREHAVTQRLRAHNATLQGALDRLQVTAEQLHRAEELIRTDELTGLPNKRGLERHLVELRETHALDGLGLLLVDCDRFRAVNNLHGHAAGDRLLQSVAHLLVSVAGTDDFACRLGDDTFCVLVCADDRESVLAQAECVLATVHGLLQVPHTPPLICAVSIGACLIDAEGDWRGAHARATDALALAKRRGGNRVEWADSAR
jgi:diguanylate cyclase (GGDEF)-like protein